MSYKPNDDFSATLAKISQGDFELFKKNTDSFYESVRSNSDTNSYRGDNTRDDKVSDKRDKTEDIR